MLVNPLLPSFLDTNSLPESSLGCKTLCIVKRNFLVFGSICLISSIVHFKNGLDIFQGGLPRCLFLSWDSYRRDYFWEVFSFFRGTIFLFFLLSLFVWWYLLPMLPKIRTFLLSKGSCAFIIQLFNSFHYLSFLLLFMSKARFSMPNSIPIS